MADFLDDAVKIGGEACFNYASDCAKFFYKVSSSFGREFSAVLNDSYSRDGLERISKAALAGLHLLGNLPDFRNGKLDGAERVCSMIRDLIYAQMIIFSFSEFFKVIELKQVELTDAGDTSFNLAQEKDKIIYKYEFDRANKNAIKAGRRPAQGNELPETIKKYQGMLLWDREGFQNLNWGRVSDLSKFVGSFFETGKFFQKYDVYPFTPFKNLAEKLGSFPIPFNYQGEALNAIDVPVLKKCFSTPRDVFVFFESWIANGRSSSGLKSEIFEKGKIFSLDNLDHSLKIAGSISKIALIGRGDIWFDKKQMFWLNAFDVGANVGSLLVFWLKCYKERQNRLYPKTDSPSTTT